MNFIFIINFSLLIFTKIYLIFCDAAFPWQLGFQDPATPYMEGILSFHNTLLFFLSGVVIFVSWLLWRCFSFYSETNAPLTIDSWNTNFQTYLSHLVESNYSNRNNEFTHSTLLEVIWTLVPAIILMIIAIPSFALLYSLDEIIDPALTIKVIGHQWYWSYEYSDYSILEGGQSLNFDSYMISEDDLTIGNFRLLEVDNRLVVPIKIHVRFLVTAADVLHSWAIPSLGVKVDACPGRLNQFSLFIKREGVYYGQCSEICGVNHGFMPIVVQAVSLEHYTQWLQTKIEGIQLFENN